MEDSTLVEAARLLLERSRLTEGQVSTRLEQARSVAYWERLNPSLSVGGAGPGGVRESRAVSPRRRKAVVEHFLADGYFEIESLLPGPTMRRMRRCIEVLRREDWPPVFAFVYDQFWQVTRVPFLVRLLSTILGPGYRQTSLGWCFYIPAVQGAAGWSPHIDWDETSGKKRVTVWVPFSDATLDNGCMYVIPRRRIPARIKEPSKWGESVSGPDVMALLQACRALPARSGSVLGWGPDVIHWGSRCGDCRHPRVSLSVDFIAAAEEPRPVERPLLDAQSDLPTFALCLDVVAKAIRTYQRSEPLMTRYGELAKRLSEPACVADP